jgi:hypothetical protein
VVIERQPVTEAQFTAEELVIRVLQPARTQHFVRQVVHVLQNEQPGHQPGRQARLARTRRADAGKPAVKKRPIDLAGQPRQRMAEVDDVLQCRPQQILLTIVPWLRHRVLPTPMTHHRIAQTGENRNPKSPESRSRTRRFLQNRLLQIRGLAAPLNGLGGSSRTTPKAVI